MKYSDLAQIGKRRLLRAHIQCADPMLHMKQIFEYVLRIDSAQLAIRWNDEIESEAIVSSVENVLLRRESGEPFQYIVGEEFFLNWRFQVGPGVFIPRPETEILVEKLLKECQMRSAKIAELGAGSGNIGISSLMERPHWQWHAFEINPNSLGFAEKNRESLLPPQASYRLYHSDFFEKAESFGPYDGLVTNPPYIREDEMGELPQEVRHEPEVALDGGKNGLEVLERWIRFAPRLLAGHGCLITEIDFRQSNSVEHLLRSEGFSRVDVVQDYSHRPRVVFAKRE